MIEYMYILWNILTQWIWIWANPGRYWRTGKPGLLQSASQSQTRLSNNNCEMISKINLINFCITSPFCSFGVVRTLRVFPFSKCQVCSILLLKIFIYLSVTVLSPHCCAQAFSSCSEQGLFFVAVPGPLIAVPCLSEERGPSKRGAQWCGMQTQ